MSRAINAYSRSLLGLPVRDTSGAFRCYRVAALRRIAFEGVLSEGYSFQEEILYYCRLAGCRIGETPIHFEERRRGQSKINLWEAVAALGIIFRLSWRRGVQRHSEPASAPNQAQHDRPDNLPTAR